MREDSNARPGSEETQRWVSSFKTESFDFRHKIKEKSVDKYRQHVVVKWAKVYFPYEKAKYVLGSMTPAAFDSYLDGVIRVVVNFIELTKENIHNDIMETIEAITLLHKEEMVDREFFKLHNKVIELKKFQSFNVFIILKFVQKYYLPVISAQSVLTNKISRANTMTTKQSSSPKTTCEWSTSYSHQTFLDLCQQDYQLKALETNLLDNYVSMKKQFCGDMGTNNNRLYASGELEFPKNRDEVALLDPLSLKIGLKMGTVVGCSCILMVKKYAFAKIDLSNDHPGVTLFGAYAAYLLYRLLWLLNVSIWDNKDVQYIHFFKFGIIRAQTFRIFNEILSECVIFLIFFVVFAEALSEKSSLSGIVNPGYVSLALLIAIFIKHAYRLLFKHGKSGHDRGVFTLTILARCVMSPYYTATFRDKIAANVLTSFSRPTSDFLRGTCWLLSGQVMNSDKHTTVDDVLFCEDRSFYIVILGIQCFFGWIRMVQCLQGMKNAKWKFYPHGLNASKYGLGIVLKLYIVAFPYQSLSLGYIIMLVFNALLRWYWDVVMDWGLGKLNLNSNSQQIDFYAPWGYPSDDELGIHTKEIWSYFVDSQRVGGSEEQMERATIRKSSVRGSDLMLTDCFSQGGSLFQEKTSRRKWKCFFLRPKLFLFDQNYWIYYVAIFLDLILRFFFVISFLPQKKLVEILGNDLPFFLGCFEIMRRAMWTTFRLEWEHIKFAALYSERKQQMLVKEKNSDAVKNILLKKI